MARRPRANAESTTFRVSPSHRPPRLPPLSPSRRNGFRHVFLSSDAPHATRLPCTSQQPIEIASSPHSTASLPRMSPFVRRSLLGFRSANTLSCVHLPLQPASRNHSASEPVGISSSWRVHISRPHRNCPPGCEAPRILHLFRLVRTRRFHLSRPALTASFQGPTGSELCICPHPIGYQTSGYRRGPCSKYVRPLYSVPHLHSRLTCVPLHTVQ